MLEQEVNKPESMRSADQLRYACCNVIAILDGPNSVASALTELRPKLEALNLAELPAEQVVTDLAAGRLAAIAQQTFTTELMRAPLLDQVFPKGSLQINTDAVGDDVEVMPLGRFRRSACSDLKTAEPLYGEKRREAFQAATADVVAAAAEPPEFSVDPGLLTREYTETTANVANAIDEMGRVIELHIKPIKRSFGEWVTRKTTQYEGVGDNSTTNVNRLAFRLATEIKQLLDDPTEYLANAIVTTLAEQYRAQGRQAASLIMRDIIAENIAELDINLIKLAVPAEPASEQLTNEDSATGLYTEVLDEPTDNASLLIVGITEVGHDGHVPSMNGNPEYFPSTITAELKAPWLEGDNRRKLYWFTDGHGHRILAVNAMGTAAQAIEREVYAKGQNEKSEFEALWIRALNKAVTTQGGPSNRVFKGIATKAHEINPNYVGFPISYDGPRRQPDARRIYFTRIPVERLVDGTVLADQGVDPKTPTVALLGLCRKSTQVKLLQELTTMSAYRLRTHNVGSV